MIFRNYVFVILTGIVYFAISTMQTSCVQASQMVYDEIEKFVSPVEEVQIDKSDRNDSYVQQPDDIEENPDVNDEEQTENEETIQNPTIIEEQTTPAKEVITEQKPEEISVSTQQQTEITPVETVPAEEPVAEQEPKTHHLSFSNIYNKVENFFSRWSFDKIITLKETIMQRFSSNQYDGDLCCRPVTVYKKVATPKDFVPYYFLYPEPIKNHLEKIAFTNKITNPKELLPYSYFLKNYGYKIEFPPNVVTSQGTTDLRVLINAPSPIIEVVGKSLFAKLVIDVRNNTLYKYDEYGFPLKAYLVATGARGTRTKTGLRIVTYKEKFPYKGAPKECKRLVDPYSYGPYIIFMNAVNPKTGRQMYVDQFLHGNGNEKSIGRKVSHGCMRTNNNVMKNELSKEVNRGDYVLIINPDLT